MTGLQKSEITGLYSHFRVQAGLFYFFTYLACGPRRRVPVRSSSVDTKC